MLLSLFHQSHVLFGANFLPKELANPQRILVTNFGSSADVVRCVPMLVALRHRFPHAEIAWLIEESAAPLLLDHWAVNRLIVVRNHWLKHVSEVRRVRKRLLAFAPQVAVDPQNSFSSSFATWLSGAQYRIGYGRALSRRLHNVRVFSETKHRVERNLQLLQPFGIFGTDIAFDMPECEKDRLAARIILQRAGVHGNFALLHISADSPRTQWKEERFGMVAKHLFEEWNLPSLVVWSGFEQESRRAEAAVHAAEGAAHKALWTTLGERRSLAKLSTIFIGADTAELQLAAAVGTHCVGLFGPTSALENAPAGQHHRAVQVLPEDARKMGRRASLLGWMDAIEPAKVCAMCDEVLTQISLPSSVPMQQEPAAPRKAA